MSSPFEIHKNIAAILSFENSNLQLEPVLKSDTFNWDYIVVEGSKHLVLPALYCRLKARKILYLLPTELKTYLEYIADINRNRNISILRQVEHISKLLNSKNISHVFLKGAAMLASGRYTDLAERMVGDIDILVDPKQIQTAFNLIKSNGYDKTIGYAYETIGFRHLDRLVSEDYLAAIELHNHVFDKKNHHLIDNTALLNSISIVNNIAIPSPYYLNLNNILAWQINDNGHYYNIISLKSLYDSLVLELPKDNKALAFINDLKPGRSYVALAKRYFHDYDSVKAPKHTKIIYTFHCICTKYLFLSYLIITTKSMYYNILKRITTAIENKHYRKHLKKKIFPSCN